MHSLLACYQCAAFALVGIHAAVLLRHPKSSLFKKAFAITFGVAALIQPLSGDRSAKHSTLRLLLIAIALGSVLLFPSLYVLYRIFKGSTAFRGAGEE